MNELMNILEFKYDFYADFCIKTGNTTKVNHLIPANYYQKWTKSTKKARDEKINLSKTENPIGLQDFMSRKFIITQDLENWFTNYVINGTKYDTEQINLLKKLQKHINKKNIDSFYYSSVYNKISVNQNSEKINQYEMVHIKKELENFDSKKIECNLYLDFFKARLSLWEFSENIASDTTRNLLKTIINVIEKNNNNDGLYYYRRTINFLLSFLNIQIYLKKYQNKEITEEQLQIELILKNYAEDLIVLKNKKQILKILKNLANFLENNKYEDSLFSAHINSEFFKDFLETIRLFSLEKSYIILSSNSNLTTGESPMVNFKISKEKTKKTIEELVINYAIDKKYLIKGDETEVFFVPYSKNILIVQSDNWYLDYLLNFMIKDQQEKIVNFYENIKNIHNIDNDYQILINT